MESTMANEIKEGDNELSTERTILLDRIDGGHQSVSGSDDDGGDNLGQPERGHRDTDSGRSGKEGDNVATTSPGASRKGTGSFIVFIGCLMAMAVAILHSSPPPQSQRYHDPSFPGRNDSSTLVNACAARIIVDLERAYSSNQSLPHSLLLLRDTSDDAENNDKKKQNYYGRCSEGIPSLEVWGSCCSLPISLYSITRNAMVWSSPFNGTISEWVEYCRIESPQSGGDAAKFLTALTFWYDPCFPELFQFDWGNEPCEQVISIGASERQEILSSNLSLVGGQFTGTVVRTVDETSSTTAIYVPDRQSDSCWRISCNGGIRAEQCMDFAQNHLVEVTLQDYVDVVKQMELD